MIIDIHQHVLWEGWKVKDLLDYMERAGVSVCVIHTWEEFLGGLRADYQHISIENTWKAYEAHPDKFIPFYSPDPLRPDAPRVLREWIARGVKGMGEHKHRMRFDDPDSVTLYKICADHGLPILFHMESIECAPKWYNEDIDAVDKICRQFRDVVFIGHAPGFWRHISGRPGTELYPTGKVAPGGKLIRMLSENPNLYADVSAGSGLGALMRDEENAVQFIHGFSHKILYGVDGLGLNHLNFLTELRRKGRISQEELDNILHRNAARILNLAPPAGRTQ